MIENNLSLGNNMVLLRVRKQLTVKALSEQSGVANTTIVYIENDRKLPTKPTLAKLVRGMNYPETVLHDLFRLLDEKKGA